jgi:predicted O-methyltransferase YrrM
MNFTQDWFSYNIPHLEQLVGLLPMRQSFLEIGCFEGRATCWFLEHALEQNGIMTCIDPFQGSMEHSDMDLTELHERFVFNVATAKKPNQQLDVIKRTSYTGIAKLIEQDRIFDFIYVDGSHTAADVLIDACMSWPLLKKGGIMVFDDYHWNPNMQYNEYQTPKRGVDAFSHCFADQFKVVHDGYQIAVQKL